MRGLVTVLLAVITGMFCSFVTYLPFIGDVNSAPNQHVTPVYIERSVQDTGSPNIVTGLLADYRGFDTMWETTVMFLAGLTAVRWDADRKRRMRTHEETFRRHSP